MDPVFQAKGSWSISKRKKNKEKKEEDMLYPQHFHNTLTTNPR